MAEEKKVLFAKINEDLKLAMKEKNQQRLNVLRMVKSKILYVNARGDLADTEIIKIIKKYGKDLKESIVEFEKVGRTEEVAAHNQELKIVAEYLPAEISPEEIKKVVGATVKELGTTSIKEMGSVMKACMAKLPGADGKVVSQSVRELLK